MKIYVAAPWVRRDEAIAFGERLKASGHTITSRWFYHQSDGDPKDATGVTCSLSSIIEQAHEDIKDVMSADILVVLNLQKSEGKAVETGIALANNIPIISVGPRSNIFQTLGTELVDQEAAIDFINQQ